MIQRQIPHEEPPSIAQILERVPLPTQLLSSKAFSGPRELWHYENELCLSIQYLAMLILSNERGFVVAPQGLLRPVIALTNNGPPDDDNDNGGTQTDPDDDNNNNNSIQTQTGSEEMNMDAYSFSSTGAAHLQRGSGEQTPTSAQNSYSLLSRP